MKNEYKKKEIKRVAGFEPARRTWKDLMLPLHHTRFLDIKSYLSLQGQDLLIKKKILLSRQF